MSGLLRCVLSCLQHHAGAQQHQQQSRPGLGHGHTNPSAGGQAQLGWVSETWVVTLEVVTQHQQQPVAGESCTAAAGASSQPQQPPQLRVVDCQLLLVSRAPSVAATAAAESNTLLLVCAGGLEPDELTAGGWVGGLVVNRGQCAENVSSGIGILCCVCCFMMV